MQRARSVPERDGRGEGVKKRETVKRDCDKVRNRERNWARGVAGERRSGHVKRIPGTNSALFDNKFYLATDLLKFTQRHVNTGRGICSCEDSHSRWQRQLVQIPRDHAETYDRESLFISLYPPSEWPVIEQSLHQSYGRTELPSKMENWAGNSS